MDRKPETYILYSMIENIVQHFLTKVKFFNNRARLFSFKNYQLMSVTDSLFRRSGRAVAKPIGVNLRKYLCFYEPFSIGMVIETVLYSVP